ncbi:DUF4199 domain-containing protein [Paludifilum halophilum]|uniref:Uncharacterized protein n=1 Tax=Paludifilum halophilum TaxID=1642702 RepID=A0A235B335_9BACL|nr:DUF4199 domain-containing protein [Paludifilum halophilum]OYD06317.1 hypothetical protein CHM34_16500 [Paludifilum halophilum]
MIHVVLATLLSIIYPGVGQIYNRQRMKGIVIILVYSILGYISIGNIYLMSFFMIIWVLAILDSLWTAVRMVRKKVNRGFLQGKRAVIEVGIALTIALLYVWFSVDISQPLWTKESHQPPQKVTSVQKEAKNYLKDKYGDSFKVEKPQYITEFNKYRMKAYPQDDPKLRFTVTKRGSQPFEDTYVIAALSKQSQEEMQPLIDKLYPDVWVYESHVGIENEAEKDMISKNMLDYQEVRNQYPGQYTQHVDLKLIKDLEGKQKEVEMRKILKTIQFFKENRVQKVNLNVTYYSESLPEKARDQKIKLGNYYEYLTFEFDMNPQDINKINKLEDVKERFQKLN